MTFSRILRVAPLYLALLVCHLPASYSEDLYQVLGVPRSASVETIKRAYKRLALEWHPDKNRDPSAEKEFTRISGAYSVLSKGDSRRHYDLYGEILPVSPGEQGRGWSKYGGHKDPHFFSRQNTGSKFERKYGLNLRHLKLRVLPESHTLPLLFYWCSYNWSPCEEADSFLQAVLDKLIQTKIQFGILETDLKRDAARLLGVVGGAPSGFGVIVGGKAVLHNNGQRNDRNSLGVHDILNFVSSHMPGDVVTKITDSNFEEFLLGMSDNRVRVVMVGPNAEPPLNFLSVALSQQSHLERSKVVWGYICNGRKTNARLVLERYDISGGNTETLLTLREGGEPGAFLSKSKIPAEEIISHMDANPYLHLPRLASQTVLEDRCPLKSLCVILVIEPTDPNTLEIAAFRNFTKSHRFVKVGLLYLDASAQRSFLSHFKDAPAAPFKILLLYRVASDDVRYQWEKTEWSAPVSAASTLSVLKSIMSFSNGKLPLSRRVYDRLEVADEYRKGLLFRIWFKLGSWWSQSAGQYLYNLDSSSIITAVWSCVFTGLLTSLFYTQYLKRPEKEEEEEEVEPEESAPDDRGTRRRDKQGSVFQMNRDHYQNAIMYGKQGVRTVVLLTDEANMERLIPQFSTMVYPYYKGSSNLLVSALRIDRYLMWYKHLLTATFGDDRDFSVISAARVSGTVLVINGYRKYFHLFHQSARSDLVNRNTRRSSDGDGKEEPWESFLGFSDNDSESSECSVMGNDTEREAVIGSNESEGSDNPAPYDMGKSSGEVGKEIGGNVDGIGPSIDELDGWLERVWDGSVTKCRVEKWPLFPQLSSE